MLDIKYHYSKQGSLSALKTWLPGRADGLSGVHRQSHLTHFRLCLPEYWTAALSSGILRAEKEPQPRVRWTYRRGGILGH
jgi:hypothetical protein